MAKRGEIPDEKNRPRSYKNAATVEQVAAVRGRVEAIGWGWHDAVADAKVSRNVGYTLLKGKGSIGSLREVEEWLKRKEETVAAARARDPREVWASLGEELTQLGEEQMAVTIEAVTEYISAEKRRRAAFLKLLRVNPDPKK